jgi:hypothetical protein
MASFQIISNSSLIIKQITTKRQAASRALHPRGHHFL